MNARKGSQMFEHPNRKMWFSLCRTRDWTRNGTTRTERTTHGVAGTGEDFSWSFRSRRLAFMCILCIYYGCLPGIARQNHRSLKNSSFCSSAGLSLETVPHNVRESWVPGRGLINWHRDTCPAGLGGPLAFNDTRQSHRFRSLSSMIAIARLTEGQEKLSHYLSRW